MAFTVGQEPFNNKKSAPALGTNQQHYQSTDVNINNNNSKMLNLLLVNLDIPRRQDAKTSVF